MDEEITEDEPVRSKKKIVLLGAVLLGMVLLCGGGWLLYKKMGAMTAEPGAETMHREPSESERRIALARKGPLDTRAPVKLPDGTLVLPDVERIPVPVVGGSQVEVSVDQVNLVVGESGERRVKARLVNHARKRLVSAQVHIDFLGSAGEVLLSRSVNPLVVSGGLFGDQAESLEPGTSRTFHVSVDDAPASWAGQVIARVTGFQFASGSGADAH